MVLRSAREDGAFPMKAVGRSARRAGVGLGTAGTASAFVSGAGSLGQILTDRPGRSVWAESRGTAGGVAARDAAALNIAASNQQAGLARKRSTPRMKVT
jgi:hypothetical protein